MSDLPIGFDIDGVRFWASARDPGTFFYIPGDPSPERDPSGRPTLLLMTRDRGAMLQLGTRWTVDQAKLAALPKRLAEKFPDFRGSIRLSPAPVTAEPVTLLAGDGAGRLDEVASVRSSGFPPYAALFNLSLGDDQRQAAMAALNGRAGFLAVRYRIGLPVEVSAETTIAGDVREDLAKLGPTATPDECRRRIDAALAAGRLAAGRKATAGATAELRERVDRLALDKGARLLCEMAQQAPMGSTQSSLEASAFQEETMAIVLERVTDVSTWFAAGDGRGHVRVLPGPAAPAKPSAGRAVKLGFDPADAPLAFVQAGQGTQSVTLRPPGFGPVTLAASDPAGSLAVKTHYTDGGPPFETTVAAEPEGWTLAPAALGLVRLSLDGSALPAAGARTARVQVRYRPSASGTLDDRTIHLRNGTWTAEWYVVTRSGGLEGVIEFEGKQTAADGTINKIRRSTTTETIVRL